MRIYSNITNGGWRKISYLRCDVCVITCSTVDFFLLIRVQDNTHAVIHCFNKTRCPRTPRHFLFFTHSHEIPGNILKLEQYFSSTGKVLELIKGPGKK